MSDTKADVAFKKLFSPKLVKYIKDTTYDIQKEGLGDTPEQYSDEIINGIFEVLKKNSNKFNLDINDLLDVERGSDTGKRQLITFLDMGANSDLYDDNWYEYKDFGSLLPRTHEKLKEYMPLLYGDEFESVIGAPYEVVQYARKAFNHAKDKDAKTKKAAGGLYKLTYAIIRKKYPDMVEPGDVRKFIDMLVNKGMSLEIKDNILQDPTYEQLKHDKEERERVEQENKAKDEALRTAEEDKKAAEEDKKAAEERTKEVKDDMTEKLASMSTKNKELREIAAKVEPISEFFDKYAVSLAETVGRHDIKHIVDDAYKREMWKDKKDDMVPKILKEYPTIETKEDAEKVADLIRGKKMNEVIERRKKMRAMDQIARLNPEELAIFDDNMRQQLINYQNKQLQDLQQARNMHFMPPRQYIKYKKAVERHINPMLLRGNGRHV